MPLMTKSITLKLQIILNKNFEILTSIILFQYILIHCTSYNNTLNFSIKMFNSVNLFWYLHFQILGLENS